MKYPALFAFLLIASCSQAVSESKAEPTPTPTPTPSAMSDLYDGNVQIMEPSISVFTDPETKCQYLIMQNYHSGGITARLGRDGRIMCLDQ